MWFFGREKVPIQKREWVEVRLEAIGGQGANSAGKILAEAAILGEGHTGNHFSSFGSEKRGTPVKSFVRFSPARKPVRSASYIRHPDLLVVFHEFMIETHPEVFSGVDSNTDVLINSTKYPHELAFPKGVHPRWVGSIDASEIALKKKCGLNAVMLGAMSAFLPEIGSVHTENVVQHFFEKLSDEDRRRNLEGYQKGQHDVRVKTARPDQDRIVPKHEEHVRLGYENAPIGGMIVNPGNSVLKSHEASRKGFAPSLNKYLCFDCGRCDQVCPDYCFVWKQNPAANFGAELVGIDYQYCKGCQKCIQVCPVDALTLTPENEIPEKDKALSWLEANKNGG